MKKTKIQKTMLHVFLCHLEHMLRTFIDVVDDKFKYYFTEMMICLDQMEQKGDKESHRVLHCEV